MADETRVVVVKPGDVLAFGNVGPVDPEALRPPAAQLKDLLQLKAVVFFNADIDMAALPADGA